MTTIVEQHAGPFEDGLSFHRPSPRLVEFLCEEHHRSGRHDAAVRLAWGRFRSRPSLASYQRLAHHASRSNGWSEWRPEAIAVLRRHVDEARRRASTHSTQSEQRFFRTYHPAGARLLVEVLIWEGDFDGAWEEAQGGGCPHRLWMRLAPTQERNDPFAAIAIYRREVEQLMGLKTKRAHAQAAQLTRHIEDMKLNRMDMPR